MARPFQGKNLNASSRDTLERAYEAACDELQKDHKLSYTALAEMIEPMVSAMLNLYVINVHEELQLKRYAVATALATLKKGSSG